MKWLISLSWVCFGVLTLMVVEMTRRPLCVDSKIVERIDRLTGDSTETVYRCAYNRNTSLSTYFHQNIKSISTRIQMMERILEHIEPFSRKVHVTIFEDRPYLFRVQGHHIYIGQALLEAPGHLEKALAKAWYRERHGHLFVNEELMEEVLTDLLLFLQEGDLNMGDPDTHIKTALHRAKWPYVLKTTPAYCESPWKNSEHYAICKKPLESQEDLSGRVVQLSLRPLLTSSWIASYKSLPLAQKNSLIKSIPQLLRGGHNPELPIVPVAQGVGRNSFPLHEAAEAVKNINLFVSTSHVMKNSEAHRLFITEVSRELRKIGFQDVFAEAHFDLLFVSAGALNEDSLILRHFMKLAKSQPQIHIALRDANNIWMLPAKYPIPVKSFGQMKAGKTIVEKCGGFDFNFVMEFAESTEKLLVVESCDQMRELQFTRYLKQGAEGFASQNKGVAFVQFHLPSLVMKKSELTHVRNVFELIQQREVESKVFQSLGWQEIKWSEQAAAYYPKAYIDAIEWFRTPQAN